MLSDEHHGVNSLCRQKNLHAHGILTGNARPLCVRQKLYLTRVDPCLRVNFVLTLPQSAVDVPLWSAHSPQLGGETDGNSQTGKFIEVSRSAVMKYGAGWWH